GALKGAREFRRSLSEISQSASKMVKATDYIRAGFRELGDRAGKTGSTISADFRKTAQSIANSSARIAREAANANTALEKFTAGATKSTSQLVRDYQRLPAAVTVSSRAVRDANANTAKSFDLLGRSITSVRTLLVGFAAGFSIRTVVGQIAQFDQSIANIRALMGPGALQSDVAAVSAKARELGATTVYSAGEAAGAMRELVLAGFSAQQAMTAAGAALNLAAADNMDLATAAEITANVVASYGLRAEEASRVSDVLAVAATGAATSVVGLGEGFKYVGPVAKALGVSVEDTAVMLGALSNAGIDASMAGTGLRQILTGLINPSKQAREELKSMGVDLGWINTTLRKPGGLIEVIDLFREKNVSAAQAVEILGDRGGPALLALTAQEPGIQKLAESMKTAEGAAAEMAATMTDSLSGAWKEFQSAAEELILQLGDAGLKDVLRGAAEAMGGFARGLAGMAEDTKKSTTAMQEWNKVGSFLRENGELLTDMVVVLAGVFVSRLVGSLYATVKAGVAARLEMIRYQSTLATMAGVSRTVAVATGVATTAMSGLRVAMAALGGPVGVVLLAATALMTFANNADDAKISAESLGAEIDTLKGKFASAGAEQRKLYLMQASESQRAAQVQIKAINERLEASRNAEREIARVSASPIPMSKAGQEMRGGQLAGLQAQVLNPMELQKAKAEIEGLQAGIVKSNMAMLEMKGIADGTHASLGEAAGKAKDAADAFGGGGGGGEDGESLAAAAKKAEQEFNKLKTAANDLMGDQNALAAATVKHAEQEQLLARMAAMSEKELAKLGYTHAQVKIASDNLALAWAKQQKELDPLVQKYEDTVEKMKAVAKQVRPMDTLTADHNKSIADYTKLLSESDEALQRMGVTRAEVVQAIQDENAAYQQNTLQINKNAKQADPWTKAWESAIERIDGMFANLWSAAFDGFDSFKDSVKDGLKQIAAELLNGAFTRGMTAWLGNVMGGSGGGGWAAPIAAGVGMLGNNMDGFLQVSNGAGGTVASAQTGMSAAGGGGGSGTNWSSIGGLMAKGFVKYAPQIASGASAIAPYAAGAAGLYGAYYGYKNAGSGGASSVAAGISYGALGYSAATVGIGALAGGAGAAAGAGMGAAAGGAMAGGMGAAAAIPVVGWILAAMALIDMVSGGKLFGTKYAVESAQTNLNIGAGGGDATQSVYETRQKALFGGKKRRTREVAASAEAEKAADELFKSVKNLMEETAKALDTVAPDVIAASIGTKNTYNKKGKVTGTTMTVTAGGQTRDVKDAEEAARWINAESIMAVIKSVFPKASAIRAAWGDSLEALEQGVQVFMELLTAVRMDPVKEAQKAYDQQVKSGLELYRAQRTEWTALMGTFDGTASSIQNLTAATSTLKQSQMELILAYKQLSDYGKTMFGGTKQNIRESLMDPEQLYGLRQTQIQDLMGQMRTEMDPAKLQALADEINRLTTDAYNMLDEDQRSEMAGGFLSFLDEAEALLADRAKQGLDQVSSESQETTNIAMQKLNEAADRQIAAANTFAGAVNAFAGAIRGGGSVGGRYAEIMAR
ncbi:MAG TPA: phage tail tape measure protein, partial [Rhizobacter sp.]